MGEQHNVSLKYEFTVILNHHWFWSTCMFSRYTFCGIFH